MSNPILLLDISNLAHRFGNSQKVLAHKGKLTGAIFGILSELVRLITRFEPGMIIAGFDKGHTYRSTVFPSYKGDRPRDALYSAILSQMDELRECFQFLPLRSISIVGEESDDIIGHYCLVDWLSGKKIIISNDKDMMQLINDKVYVFSSYKGLIAPANFINIYNCKPEAWLEARMMIGKDNINGIMGIGKKYAIDILNAHSSIENALAADLDGQPKKIVNLINKLRSKESQAILDRNRKLLQIRDVKPSADDIEVGRWDKDKFVKFVEAHGFKSIIKVLDKYEKAMLKVDSYKTRSYFRPQK